MSPTSMNGSLPMEYQPSFGHDAPMPDMARSRPTDGLLSCIKRHKLLMTVTTLGLMILATAAVFAVPKTYTATGSVIVDPMGPEAVNLGRVLPEGPLERDTIASEVEILNSRELLQNVVTELDLVSNPKFNPNLDSSRLSEISHELTRFIQGYFGDWTSPSVELPKAQRDLYDTVNAVRRHLLIEQEGQSRVIRCAFSSTDPAMAALIVNTLMSRYRDDYIRLREQANEKAHGWITQRLTDLRNRADTAAQAAETYRASHGLTRGRETTLVQEEISQVNAALATARQRRDEAESALVNARLASSSGGGGHIGAVLDSQLIQRLREQEAVTAAKMADLTSRYGPASPVLGPVKAQLDGTQRAIQTEISRITRSISDKAALAKANEESLNARLGLLRSRIAQMDADIVPLQRLERQANVERDLYANFLSRSKETDPWLEYPAARVRVLSTASVPARASFPNKTIALPLAFLGSLLFATMLARIVDVRTRGILSMDEIDQLLGVPSLGLIPLARQRKPFASRVFREAVSLLFVRLLQSQNDRRSYRSVLITSAVPGEGKSITAMALALEGAERGLNVLLVDGDLRSRSLSGQVSRDPAGPGLADVLRGEIALNEAIKFASEFGISFLPAGGAGGSPGYLLGLPSLRDTIETLERRYDLVVIDSPPVLAGVDTWLLGHEAGMTVMLARWRHTSVKQAALAVKMLTGSQAKLAGVVLSMVNVTKNAQYDHGDAILFSSAMQRYYSQNLALPHQRGAGTAA